MPYNEWATYFIWIQQRLNNSLSKFCSQRKAIKEKGCGWIGVVKEWAVSKFHFWCWAILSWLVGFCFSLRPSKKTGLQEWVLIGLLEFAWCLEERFGALMNVISKIRSVITLLTFVIVFLVVDSAFEIKCWVFENEKDGGDLCCCVMQFHLDMFLFKKIVFHRFFYSYLQCFKSKVCQIVFANVYQ